MLGVVYWLDSRSLILCQMEEGSGWSDGVEAGEAGGEKYRGSLEVSHRNNPVPTLTIVLPVKKGSWASLDPHTPTNMCSTIFLKPIASHGGA